MSNKTNYWSMKKDDLANACLAKGIEIPKDKIDDRSWQIENLQNHDEIEAVKAGESKEIAVEDLSDDPLSKDRILSAKPGEELVKIMFHFKSENEPPYVFLGLNGVCLYIPKEEPYYIPKTFIKGCLENAVEKKVTFKKDPRTGHKRQWVKTVPRISYTIME